MEGRNSLEEGHGEGEEDEQLGGDEAGSGEEDGPDDGQDEVRIDLSSNSPPNPSQDAAPRRPPPVNQNSWSVLTRMLSGFWEMNEDSLMVTLVRVLIFLGYLLLLFLIEHLLEIGFSVWCFCVAAKLNDLLKQQVALKREYDRTAIVNCFFGLVTQIGLTVFISKTPLITCLLLIPPDPSTTLLQRIWIVYINDYLLCYIGMTLKCFFLLFASSHFPEAKVPQALACIEHTIQNYRRILPIPIWWSYMGIGDSTSGAIVALLYLGAKLSGTIALVRVLLWNLKVFFGTSRVAHQFGRDAKPEELLEMGGDCPVCHDKYDNPIMLECKHAFCEGCLMEWTRRKQSCPLCRKKLKGISKLYIMFHDGSSLISPTLY